MVDLRIVSIGNISAGILAGVLKAYFSAQGASLESVALGLIEMGAPTVVGATVANWVAPQLESAFKMKKNDEMEDLTSAIIGGLSTTALLMLPEFIPRALDETTILTFAISAGSIFIGQNLQHLIKGNNKTE